MTDVSVPPLMNYIDGKFVAPPIDMGVSLENPNTGEKIQQQLASTDEQVEEALAAAWRVHTDGSWRIYANQRTC